MRASIVPIGNSKGIRIPKPILEQCEIRDEVDLSVRAGRIILQPVRKAKSSPRSSWDKALKAMHEAGDDRLLLEASLDADLADWKW